LADLNCFIVLLANAEKRKKAAGRAAQAEIVFQEFF
jgi:hypothetical protein